MPAKKPPQRPIQKGRPMNPEGERMHVKMSPDLKRRVALCAITDSVTYHHVIATAVSAYLDKRGVR